MCVRVCTTLLPWDKALILAGGSGPLKSTANEATLVLGG